VFVCVGFDLCCFLLLHLWLCDFVSLLLLAFSPLQEQRVKSYGPLPVNNEIRTLHLSISDPRSFQLLSPKPAVDNCKACYCRWPGQSFILSGSILSLPRPDLAGTELLTTPREAGSNPVLPAQLCWSSGSSFPCICNTTCWNWLVTKLIYCGCYNSLPACAGVFFLLECWFYR